jgi:hypothetical protein
MERLYYRITVKGEIGPRCAAAFDGMEIRAAHGEPTSPGQSSTNHTSTDFSTGSPISDSPSAASPHSTPTHSHAVAERAAPRQTQPRRRHLTPEEVLLTTANLAVNRRQLAVQFRYGIVFPLTLALVVFVISAPAPDWSRAVAAAIPMVTLGGLLRLLRQHGVTIKR